MRRKLKVFTAVAVCVIFLAPSAFGGAASIKPLFYDLGKLKPVDSELKVKSGDLAPDFTLPSISGNRVTLSQFRGKKNVVISFVPAAWTPVCSEQWPGYNMVKEQFEETNTVLLGITVDNIPTLKAWTQNIGPVWFDVLSDFWAHGASIRIFYTTTHISGRLGIIYRFSPVNYPKKMKNKAGQTNNQGS